MSQPTYDTKAPHPFDLSLLPRPEVMNLLLAGLSEAQSLRQLTSHVSARDLVDGVLQYAAREWGTTAPLVFEAHGLTTSEALGAALWRMVELGVVSKREEDRLEDFQQGRDLLMELVPLIRPALTPPALLERVATWNPGEALLRRRQLATSLSSATQDGFGDDDELDEPDEDEVGDVDSGADPASGD